MRKPVRPARHLKTPHIVVFIVAAVAIPLTISGFAWAKKGVTVVVNGASAYYTTEAETVSEVLDEVDIAINEGDVVSPMPETAVSDGTEIVVRKAIPVTLQCNGSSIELRVVGSTVADALVAAGLDPSAALHVTPPVEAELSQGMTITATDLYVRIVKEEGQLPFETVEQEDAGLLRGQRRVVQQGVPGTGIRVWEVLMLGDTETTRTVKAEQVIIQPVAQIVRVGTKQPVVVTKPASAYTRPGATASAAAPVAGATIQMTSTAYTPWDSGCGGIGVVERKLAGYHVPEGWGIVAVDPSVIALGTKVYVPGYGYAVAADTGGSIKGNRIDVCFWTGGEGPSKIASRAWGRRSVTVTIVE